MKKSDGQSLHKSLAFAATLAALGVSVGVPVERALAAQMPGAHEDRGTRTRPLVVAFTLVEQPGQKQGMGDGSVKQGAHPGGVNASHAKIEKGGNAGAAQGERRGVIAIRKGSSIGAKQGKYRTGATQLKITTPGGAGGQLPAVQK